MILQGIKEKSTNKQKQLAVLIDPDKGHPEHLAKLATMANEAKVDLFFIGGSLMVGNEMEETIRTIKSLSDIPVVLFPGSPSQVCDKADGILLLSLISGRNADLLIGQQVIAAPAIKKSGLEVLPTGYMLIDGGRPTTASYISASQPIPANKPEIAAVTAMTGEMMGLQLMYADAGSGADNPVSPQTIAAIKKVTQCPLVVGGGMKTPEDVARAYAAGADIAVVGNAFEDHPDLLFEIAETRFQKI
ncbi:MAG: geranylgeranylglyceryl/heptaprenylglyceryl phosphate synthase [Salibacteraceae bacterium]